MPSLLEGSRLGSFSRATPCIDETIAMAILAPMQHFHSSRGRSHGVMSPAAARECGAALLIAFLVALPGCGQSRRPVTQEESAALTPTTAKIASLYERSCKTCHTEPASGAPLTGNGSHWDVRWEKGEAALLQSTITGLNGMPAGGQCVDCSPDDYRALIRFMAGREH